MSFLDFQRQIENVNDPALVEQWKEEARKVTTFVTRQEEPARTFNTEFEAERHFREKYLPGLFTESAEAEIDGVTSRRLPDRGIARLIENTWSAEVASPSSMRARPSKDRESPRQTAAKFPLAAPGSCGSPNRRTNLGESEAD